MAAPAKYRLYFDEKHDTWRMRKRYRGTEHNFDCETANKSVAIKRANARLDDLIKDAFGEAPRKTVAEAIERFVERQFPRLKPLTQQRYENALAHVLEALGGRVLDKLSKADLDEYEHARRQHVSPQTVGYEIRVFGTVLEHCMTWEWCEKNVAILYRREAAQKHSDIMTRNRRTRYLSADEERTLLAYAELRRPSWFWRIMFAIETGLRLSEQFTLQLGDINFQSERIRVRKEHAKSGRERFVPLTARAREAVRHMHVYGSPYVSPREDGKPFALKSSKPWENLVQLAKGAGIEDVRWHDLRRTCGCRLLQDRGFRLEDVQVWLGHASIKETEASYAFLKIDHVHARLRASQPGLMIEHRGGDD